MELNFDFRNLFVLDLANNHQGSVEHGLEVIRRHAEVVRRHGVRAAIKFQFRDIDSFIHPAHKRDSGNKNTEKNFPGGVLYLGWSNSPWELASKPIKKLALDEVDRYPVSLRDEGSPVKVAEQRTANFPRRKILKTSTPKIKGASVIAEEYESSSQAQYWVPCPHCGKMIPLRIKPKGLRKKVKGKSPI